MNPIFYIDFYKVGHVSQYAPGTQQVGQTGLPVRAGQGETRSYSSVSNTSLRGF